MHVPSHELDLQFWSTPQVVPHAPQLALSVVVFAQYPAPPSPLGHPICPEVHVETHVPEVQTSSTAQVIPQPPQFVLSPLVLAQYGAPASGTHAV
jgi:hypothetical protein